ncbi:hypothetical protein OH492_01630 [Vibrio chagasii]|nr:hypothetical protein [Vibrio chagasii]
MLSYRNLIQFARRNDIALRQSAHKISVSWRSTCCV